MEESKKATQVKTNVSKSSDKQKSAPEKKGKISAIISAISAFTKGLKTEFSRIVWPTRDTVVKQISDEKKESIPESVQANNNKIIDALKNITGK